MKKRLFLVCIAVLCAGTIFFTTGNAKTHAAVGGDPYATGCANNSYIATAGTLEYPYGSGHTIAWIYNYYSRSCNTNWLSVGYDSSAVDGIYIDIHQKGVSIYPPSSSNHQCYPTDCNSWYYGGGTASWTDMVDGTPVNCVFVNTEINPQLVGQYGDGAPWTISTNGKYGSNDALCA